MTQTKVRSAQIGDGEVKRDDLNVATTGQAVVRKIVQGTGITVSGDGVDAGTGDVTISAAGGAPPAIGTVEVSLATFPGLRRTGRFTIGGLSGLTVGKPVIVQQASGPYTGKGTRADEAEMDMLVVSGKVISATTIECFWNSAGGRVRGNFKFDYMVSG
jgi:hypothetical protein